MANPTSVTEYFEIDSEHVGDRFAISVSFPGSSDGKSGSTYALLYATDGNTFGSVMDATRFCFVGFDAVRPVQPYLQVNIGYPPSQASSQAVLRNRDLVPPGEGFPSFMAAHVRSRLGADTPDSTIQAFLEQYKASRADNFLAFIEDELHPVICGRYSVQESNVGLFGYSSGGLFTLYALTSGSRLFTRFGASSPGVHVEDSKIFDLYDELLKRTDRFSRSAHLHLTVNSYELLGPVRLYRALGINLLRFLDMVDEHPLPGLRVTTELILGESHYGGFVDAYRSFLRSCYSEEK